MATPVRIVGLGGSPRAEWHTFGAAGHLVASGTCDYAEDRPVAAESGRP